MTCSTTDACCIPWSVLRNVSGQTIVYFMNFLMCLQMGDDSDARNQLGVQSMSNLNIETRSFNLMHSASRPLILNAIQFTGCTLLLLSRATVLLHSTG